MATNTIATIIIVTTLVCLTLLVAIGKIDPVYLTAIVSGVVGWVIPPPSVKPATVAKISILPLILACSCAGSFETARTAGLQSAAPPSPHCEGLDSDRSLFSALAKGLAAASGAQGLSALPINDATGREILAAGVVLTAAGAIIVQTIADSKSTSWVRDCQ